MYKNEIKICESITKLDRKGTYYTGYLESHKEEKECNSYFYINSVKKENMKFNLTEKNMADKFKETDCRILYYKIIIATAEKKTI
ncbi:hypothetical protein [Leptotrichia sp. OH3620_COT-345]|uniref:hypothetical protein n=1 Tax=Leptotrichia sp. OH3620_COT-345 TaxID=2491048 RepID=UPI0011D00052|nr:hypothetical protein [Leptotrichia sp. OH3620_COT-345]